MIHPTPPERIQEVQDALRAEFSREAPTLANTQNTLALGQFTHLEFHGRLYQVPPTPYREGAELQELMALTHQASRKRDWEERGRLNARAAGLFYRLVRPVSLWQRLLWPLLGNPFHQASEEEIQELYIFFFACRTKSTVRSHFASAPAAPSR